MSKQGGNATTGVGQSPGKRETAESLSGSRLCSWTPSELNGRHARCARRPRERYVQLYRLSRRGPGQMPPLVSHRVDGRARSDCCGEWIAHLKARTNAALHDSEVVLSFWPNTELGGTAGRSFAAGQTRFTIARVAISVIAFFFFAGTGGTVGTGLGRAVGRRYSPPRASCLSRSLSLQSCGRTNTPASHDFRNCLRRARCVASPPRPDSKRCSAGWTDRSSATVASESVRPTDAREKENRRPTKQSPSSAHAGRHGQHLVRKRRSSICLAYLVSDGNPDTSCFK
jgi:hypothetical protein